MVQINFAQKSVTVKIVYYGPGMSGKTTNLEVVHQRAPENSRGELTSISTDGDRTLFFDFMPLDLGTVAGMRTQFQIYTVPGQVYYNSTRKLVLQGVDGVIFVADSSSAMMEENLESLRNLQENLQEYGKDISTIPMVMQYNKRDLPDAMPVAELEAAMNPMGCPSFEGIANTGQGVFPTLKALAAKVLDTIHEQTGGAGASASPEPAAADAPTPVPGAAPMPQAPPQPTGFQPASAATPEAPSSLPAPVASTPEPVAPMPEPVAQAPEPFMPEPAAPAQASTPEPAAPLQMSTPEPAAPTQEPAAPLTMGGAPMQPEPPAPMPMAESTPAPAPQVTQAGFQPVAQPEAAPQQAQQPLQQTGFHQQPQMAPQPHQTGFHPQPQMAPQGQPQPAPQMAPQPHQTGFHPQPQMAPQGQPQPAPQMAPQMAPQPHETGFHPQPMHDTGFHQKPQMQPAAQHPEPTPQAPVQPQADPGFPTPANSLAQTQVHAPPTMPAAQPEATPSLRMNAATAPAPAPAASQESAGNLMQVSSGAPAPGARPAQAPQSTGRIRPRSNASTVATPRTSDARSGLITTVCIVAALAAGVVIGGFAFGIF